MRCTEKGTAGIDLRYRVAEGAGKRFAQVGRVGGLGVEALVAPAGDH